MYDILIRTDSRYILNRIQLRQRLLTELAVKKVIGPVEISLIVVGNRKMKALNKKYRGIDKATNVLAFPLEPDRADLIFTHSSEPDSSLSDDRLTFHPLHHPPTKLQSPVGNDASAPPAGFVFPQDGKLYLGDIIICYPIARQEAAKYQQMVDDRLGDLAVYALQYLTGDN